MEISEIELYNSLRSKLGDQEAQEFISFVNARIKNEFMDQKQIFLTKDDKVEIMVKLTRSIFAASLLNFLAIVGALVTILTFVLKG